MRINQVILPGKPDASFLPIEKALSSLSYECADRWFAVFNHCGLRRYVNVPTLYGNSEFYDARWTDITPNLYDNAKSLDKLEGFFTFKEKIQM